MEEAVDLRRKITVILLFIKNKWRTACFPCSYFPLPTFMIENATCARHDLITCKAIIAWYEALQYIKFLGVTINHMLGSNRLER